MQPLKSTEAYQLTQTVCFTAAAAAAILTRCGSTWPQIALTPSRNAGLSVIIIKDKNVRMIREGDQRRGATQGH